MSPPAPPLWLDHASVEVPVLADAVQHLHRRLGLRATISAGAPERHSRIYLDRSYLEVVARPGTTGWETSAFFLRFEEPQTLRAHLDARRLPSRFGVYQGVDGLWDDVEIDAGPVPVPILVRRTNPPEVARRWPPPLVEPHPCGARALVAVHLYASNWQPAVDFYRRLLGLDDMAFPAVRIFEGRRRMSLPLATGHLVLTETENEGLAGLVIAVRSLNETASVLGELLSRTDVDSVAWLDATATYGLRLGFMETRPTIGP